MNCICCPRKCNIDRKTSLGFCRAGEEFLLARAALHFWEEPSISGKSGSGTVFFSGCNMRCCFCQNFNISSQTLGKVVSAEKLKQIFDRLILQGAHNINLVTPSHYAVQLAPLLKNISVPVVWNSSAYEEVETLKLLKDKVQIYLPDFKFSSKEIASRYANCPDYPEKAKEAICEMVAQRGKYKIENGIMTSGVIIRHLVLPGQLENTYGVIDWVSETFSAGEVKFSLMSQFTPQEHCKLDELSRALDKREYILARNYMLKKGLTDGYCQDLSSAKNSYTPPFDFTGI